MSATLAGKTALVTGASGGLGLHFAQLLAGHGVAVTLAARRRNALDRACDEIAAAGGTAEAIEIDVTDSGSIAAALAPFDLGFDIVVNNAGIGGAGPAIDLSEAEWDRVLDTNLKGCFLVAQAVAHKLVAAGSGGAIVNIASIAGLHPSSGLSAYGASKAGLIQLTKTLALEWARYRIRVNALCPGYIETDINREFLATDAGQAMVRRIPQRRLGTPQDLDGALLLFASDAGAYITGATLAVDGGRLVSSH